LPQTRIQLQVLSGKIELNLGDAKWVQVLARRDSGYGLGSRLRNRGHFAFLLGWKARRFEPRAEPFEGLDARKSRENRSLANP
jgi:hypothetical protein